MLTVFPSHIDTYPTSENLPPLSRDWFSNYGPILTVRAGSCTMCYSLAMLVTGVGCSFASTKILMDLCSVWMNGFPTITAWDVHAISYAA